MQRTTTADVEAAFRRYVALCTENGLVDPAYEIQMSTGSKSNGIAFRVYTILRDRETPGWSGHRRPPIGGDFLGMTKAEAFDALIERNSTIADVLDALNR